VNREKLSEYLNYKPKFFYWCGADLFNVTTEKGARKVVLIESNSSPSGQKSMPLLEEKEENGGYNRLIADSFLPLVKEREKILPKGSFAVLYDKNLMEASGYAASISELTNEKCYLVEYKINSKKIFWEDGILYINQNNEKICVKAALRYVTQKPWNRIPISTKTFVYNPIIACISGGRNKLVASKAYQQFNSEISQYGLSINTPYTIRNIRKQEIPMLFKRFRNQIVVKIPYLNAGQGVFTITSQKELEEFMETKSNYSQLIVQSLIGNYSWSSSTPEGSLYHIGTMPNKNGDIYVSDLRMMVMATNKGIVPVSIYARRARLPLKQQISGESSWDVLGTNISNKNDDGTWGKTDSNRLLLMDHKDFNKLGLGIDELIESYVQCVLALIAIDKMCKTLTMADGTLNKNLFLSLNQDKTLSGEII
jgi:hypothetical protein